jgi:hypothetical protein
LIQLVQLHLELEETRLGVALQVEFERQNFETGFSLDWF